MLSYTLLCTLSAHQHVFALWTSKVRLWRRFRSRRSTEKLTSAPLLMLSYTPRCAVSAICLVDFEKRKCFYSTQNLTVMLYGTIVRSVSSHQHLWWLFRSSRNTGGPASAPLLMLSCMRLTRSARARCSPPCPVQPLGPSPETGSTLDLLLPR